MNLDILDISVKLEEGEFFLERLTNAKMQPEHFRHYLSAFLTATRSVAQYIRERDQTWYDSWISGLKATDRELFDYMKQKRDLNIHVERVTLRNTVKVTIQAAFRIVDSFTARLIRKDGSVEDHAVSKEPVPPSHKPNQIAESREYYFENGHKEVVAMCEGFLQLSQRLVKDFECRTI